MTVIDCDCSECIYNEGGYCNADMIEIVDGECNTFEQQDNWDQLDDIEKEEAMRIYRESEEEE